MGFRHLETERRIKVFMLEYFLEIFSTTCVQFVSWVPYLVAIYFLISMIGDLLFRER